jgi:quinolinate synthase
MLLWPGVCIVHEAFSETELLKLKAQHPGRAGRRAPRMPGLYPRPCGLCRETSGILQFAKTMPGDTLIVATEPHIIHQMEKALPEKIFIGAPGADGNCNCNICPYMALNTLEKIYLACVISPADRDRGRPAAGGQEEPRPDAGTGGGDRGQGDLGARS